MSLYARYLLSAMLLMWIAGCRGGQPGEEYIEPSSITTIPEEFAINYAVPQNTPFSPYSEVLVDLPAACTTSVEVYDVVGALVRTIVSEVYLEAGHYRIVWDGYDDKRKSVDSGVYMIHLLACEYEGKTKMVLLK